MNIKKNLIVLDSNAFKLFFYLFILLLVFFVIIEFCVLTFSYQKATFQSYDGFTEVDSLIIYKNYITDEHRIYRYNPEMITAIKAAYAEDTSVKNINDLHPVDNLVDIYKAYKSLTNTKTEIDKEFYFSRRIHTIVHSETISQFDSLLLFYTQNPFNVNGFRSLPFTKINGRKSILLIGDSFVHGLYANPIYNCFGDLLLSKGYVVHTAGINGTDPAQYLAIAKTYIPTLKPDLVIVVYYEGNDLMHYYRDLDSGKDHEHITNAGFLSAYPLGEYMDAQEAYEFILSTTKIPPTNWFNKLCSKSIIATRLWAVLYKLNWVSHPVMEQYYAFHHNASAQAPDITNFYLSSIDSVANENNVPLVFAVIPDIYSSLNSKNCCLPDTVSLQNVFKELPFYYSEQLQKSDFPTNNDFHFTNSGHRKYADFLEEIILKTTALQDSIKVY